MDDEALTPLEQLTLRLYDIDAIQFGKFKLASGRKSSVYLDLRVLVSYPEVLREVAGIYHQFINRLGLKFDLISAPPMAGLPIATALALEMNCPFIYPRKTAKNYGTGKGIEGAWKIGQKVLVIDDVITSGGSIVQTIAILKAAGLRVNDAVVFIDREQGGKKELAAEGYNLFSVVSLQYLLTILNDNDRISQKKYNKVIKSLG